MSSGGPVRSRSQQSLPDENGGGITLRRVLPEAPPLSAVTQSVAKFFGVAEDPGNDYSYFARAIDDEVPRARPQPSMVNRMMSRYRKSRGARNADAGDAEQGSSSANVNSGGEDNGGDDDDDDDFEFYSDDDDDDNNNNARARPSPLQRDILVESDSDADEIVPRDRPRSMLMDASVAAAASSEPARPTESIPLQSLVASARARAAAAAALQTNAPMPGVLAATPAAATPPPPPVNHENRTSSRTSLLTPPMQRRDSSAPSVTSVSSNPPSAAHSRTPSAAPAAAPAGIYSSPPPINPAVSALQREGGSSNRLSTSSAATSSSSIYSSPPPSNAAANRASAAPAVAAVVATAAAASPRDSSAGIYSSPPPANHQPSNVRNSAAVQPAPSPTPPANSAANRLSIPPPYSPFDVGVAPPPPSASPAAPSHVQPPYPQQPPYYGQPPQANIRGPQRRAPPPGSALAAGSAGEMVDAPPLYADVLHENAIVDELGITPTMLRETPALQDPKVRAQLLRMKKHRPIFMLLITLVETAMMIYASIKYNNSTGQIIDQNPFNPMIGPDPATMISLGAKFLPCEFVMTPLYVDNSVCPPEYQNSFPLISYVTPNATKVYCGDLSQYCGIASFTDIGNQWYRVITAMFVHAGFLHYAIVMFVQVHTGFKMEKDIGSIRMSAIYIISGIGGYLAGSLFSPLDPSAGASPCLCGMIAGLLLDLSNNWRLIKNPKRSLAVLIVIIVLTFAVGLLPWVDNYANFGGLVCGFLACTIFIPTITFGKWDGRRKLIMILVAIPILGLLIFGMVFALVHGLNPTANCAWCIYLDCMPVVPGWCPAQ